MEERLKLDPLPEPPAKIRKAIESETRYLQENIEIMAAELNKPGPVPWKWMDVIGKPGPTPWKLISFIANHIPAENLEKIVARGIKSEVEYIQEGIAIRQMIYDELKRM